MHLGHHCPGRGSHSFRHEQAMPKTAIAMLVRRGHRGHIHVADNARRQFASAVVHHRNEVHITLAHKRTGSHAQIRRLNGKCLVCARLTPVKERTYGSNFHIQQFFFAGEQGLA